MIVFLVGLGVGLAMGFVFGAVWDAMYQLKLERKLRDQWIREHLGRPTDDEEDR